jgi:hypothetical protein
MSENLVYEAALRLFGDLCTPAARRAAEQGELAPSLLQAIEEAGFFDVLAGAGDWSSLIDAVAILTAAGETALPAPLAGAMLARRLLATGETAGVLVAATPSALSGPAGVRWPWPQATDGAIACWPQGRGLVQTGGAGSMRNCAGEPWRAVEPAEASGGLQPYTEDCSFGDCQLFMALAHAALMAGAMVAALKLTIEHANTRVQFGRPLARQPAVQHQLALMAEQVAAAGVSVDFAARRWADGAAHEITWRAVAAAKIRSGEAAGKIAEMAHQIHGAIGFTREYRLQDLTRRLWAWRDEAGTESEWSLELGRRMIAAGADAFWPAFTD